MKNRTFICVLVVASSSLFGFSVIDKNTNWLDSSLVYQKENDKSGENIKNLDRLQSSDSIEQIKIDLEKKIRDKLEKKIRDEENRDNGNREIPDFQEQQNPDQQQNTTPSNYHEDLIKLNNACADKLKANSSEELKVYTIAVIVPKIEINQRQILQGIAQAVNENNGGYLIDDINKIRESVNNNITSPLVTQSCQTKPDNNLLLKVMLFEESDEDEKKLAETIASDGNIIAAIGYGTSGKVELVNSVYKNKSLPLLLPVATLTSLTTNSDFTFRITPNNKKIAEPLKQYISSDNSEDLLISIDDNSTYSKDIAENLSSSVQRDDFGLARYKTEKMLNKKVVALFPSSDQNQTIGNFADFCNNYQQFDDFQTDPLIVNQSQCDFVAIVREINQNNNLKKPLILTGDSAYNFIFYNDILIPKNHGELAEIVFSLPWFDKNACEPKKTALREKFLTDGYLLWSFWSENLQNTPIPTASVGWRTATSYDSVKALIKAFESLKEIKPSISRPFVKTARGQRIKLKEILLNQEFIAQGATGQIDFDENRERKTNLVQIVKLQPNGDNYKISCTIPQNPNLSLKRE